MLPCTQPPARRGPKRSATIGFREGSRQLAGYPPPSTRSFEVQALHIYVDADACPVKHETYRVADRHGVRVTLVAGSWMRIPSQPNLTFEVVRRGFDAVDDWIAAHAGSGDIVITADIPLASRCIERGACLIAPTGRPFTESNIGDALATRNLLSEMRGAGMVAGGPSPFHARDRSRYIQALDRGIHAIRRGPAGSDAS